MASTTGSDTADWYHSYYDRKGIARNDLVGNPEVLLQSFALDIAITRCVRRTRLVVGATSVLDVGCGSGSSLTALLRLGFSLRNLTGVDVLPDRVADGRHRVPGLDLRVADAVRLDFVDGSFDIVMESTMFTQVVDDAAAAGIAEEMRRIVKPTGFIILADWRMKDPRDPQAGSLNRRRVGRLFPQATVIAIEAAALAPPVGRALSSRAPSLYFPVQRLAPFLVGQVVYLLAP